MLDTAAWIVSIIYATIPSYWLIVHSRAQRWAAQGGRRLANIGPLWMLLWVVAAAATRPWRLVRWYSASWTWIPGVILIFGGLAIYRYAKQEFSTDQLLGRSELEPKKHKQSLRTSGIRAHVRHPYYLAHLCELAGWSIGSGLVVVYGLTAFAVVTGCLMIALEERELLARFGDDYRRYQARSAAMFPGAW
ncbi:MAG: isoprenylcysteine carboxylmethyltransferase family protein [Terriglobales bacterium]|jgi:protein-S-isoprenylcysteine O-methyltransferase Ste14